MSLALKVPFKKAEDAKKIILSKGLLNKNLKIKKDSKFVYFPVIKKTDDFPSSFFINTSFERIKKKKGFKERLKEIFGEDEFNKLKKGYEIIGDAALVEIDEHLKKKEKEIARILLESNKSIKKVFRKGKHFGIYRTQKLKWLAGDKNKEVVHKESGLRIKLNLEKVYFSSRLAGERLRIAKQVKPNEAVLVMFSGCAPFPLVISKHSQAKIIYGIEKNPTAHRYALENVKMNGIQNIKLYCGDVRKVVPKMNIKFDRIVMPRPKIKEDFLDVALKVIKKNGIIHFYDFLKENDLNRIAKKINSICKKNKKECKVLRIVKCGQPSVRTFRVCVDFLVK